MQREGKAVCVSVCVLKVESADGGIWTKPFLKNKSSYDLIRRNIFESDISIVESLGINIE